MIALCLEHHSRADRNAYSISQLKKLKEFPYLRDKNPVGDFSWKREKLVVRCGSNISFNCAIILQHNNIDVLYLSKDDEGNEVLNINYVGSDGEPILSMRNNNWVIHKKLSDLDCKTSGGEIRLKLENASPYFRIKFKAIEKIDLRPKIISDLWSAPDEIKNAIGFTDINNPPWSTLGMIQSIEEGIKEESLIYCEITGDLTFPYPIKMKNDKIVLNNGSQLSFCASIGSGIGFKF
jgi:hypothetical protein